MLAASTSSTQQLWLDILQTLLCALRNAFYAVFSLHCLHSFLKCLNQHAGPGQTGDIMLPGKETVSSTMCRCISINSTLINQSSDSCEHMTKPDFF